MEFGKILPNDLENAAFLALYTICLMETCTMSKVEWVETSVNFHYLKRPGQSSSIDFDQCP